MNKRLNGLLLAVASAALLAACGGGDTSEPSAPVAGAPTTGTTPSPPSSPTLGTTPSPAPSPTPGTTPSPAPAPTPGTTPAPATPPAVGVANVQATLLDGPLNFDSEVGKSSTAKRLSVSNSGTAPAKMRLIGFTGGDFTHNAAATGDCFTSTVLAPGQSCFVNVVSRPQSYGIKQSTLSIQTDAPNPQLDFAVSAQAYPTTPTVNASASFSQLGSIYNPATRTMTIDVRQDCIPDSERIYNVQRWSFYRATGLYAPPGVDIEITVGGIPAGTDVKAMVGLWQQATGVTSPSEVDPTQFPVNANGKTIIRSVYGGPIYFRATNNINPTGSVTFTVGPTAKQMPTLFLGRTTHAQWVAQLNAPDVAPYAEVVTNRTIITFNTNKVKEALTLDANADMTRIGMLYDEMLASHDFVAGLADGGGVHAKQQQPMHFTPHQRSDYYMFATYYRTAFCYVDCAPILFTKLFMLNGWGPWHEAGHMYQGAWEWSDLTEVSVNLYSLEFQKRLGQTSRLITDSNVADGTKIWDSALRNRSRVTNFDALDVFERLSVFEMITLRYGRDFWSKLHRAYRDPATRPAAMGSFNSIVSNETKRQTFILMASKISGQDLRGFFNAWGLRADASTDAAVSALGLPAADVNAMLAQRPN
jgi:Peptidase M60, enhancin and enhancin-like/N-terminal domain of M60-like peptidases